MRMLRVHIEYKSIQTTNGRIDLQYPKQFGNKHVCGSAAAAAAAAAAASLLCCGVRGEFVIFCSVRSCEVIFLHLCVSLCWDRVCFVFGFVLFMIWFANIVCYRYGRCTAWCTYVLFSMRFEAVRLLFFICF